MKQIKHFIQASRIKYNLKCTLQNLLHMNLQFTMNQHK
jgi:hypothetical protein